jgi:hypothetical protein
LETPYAKTQIEAWIDAVRCTHDVFLAYSSKARATANDIIRSLALWSYRTTRSLDRLRGGIPGDRKRHRRGSRGRGPQLLLVRALPGKARALQHSSPAARRSAPPPPSPAGSPRLPPRPASRARCPTPPGRDRLL